MNIARAHYKDLFLLLSMLIIISVAIVLISQRTRPKDSRILAGKSTILSIQPDSSATNPLQKSVGDTITMDLMVDPGANTVSFIKFEILYDATKFSIAGPTALKVISSIFPVTLEGPVANQGKIATAVGISNDPTLGITTPTKFATLTFTALQATTNNNPTEIKFGSASQVLSIGLNDQASENVLSTTQPAFIAINQGNVTIVPTSGPSPTPGPQGFTLILKLLMHGIGSAGDNANPNESILSNKNPIHQERNLNVQVVNSDNQIVATKIVPAFFDADQGIFFSNVVINESLPAGEYVVKAKADGYLRKLMPGFFTIKPGEKTILPSTGMVAGDVNGDNQLNVLDYNILYDCGYGVIFPLPMIDLRSVFNSPACQAHAEKEDADVNDDGRISASDYNLFLRELSVQVGQ